MKVNIVCNDTGWIYDQFVSAFEKYSSHTVVRNSKDKCDVTHYIPYYEVPDKTNGKTTAWFSHQEVKNPLRDKFIQAGRTVDYAISQSKKYFNVLWNNDIRNVKQIKPGVDLDRFVIRDNPPIRNKLVLGYVGRQYQSSNRKNPELLKAISKLPFVELRVTGGNVRAEDMPKFYADLDYVISPATVEGGPMCITEALAMGVPVIAFADVGIANEFECGIIGVVGNNNTFIAVLKKLLEDKVHLEWHKDTAKKNARAQVEYYTWANFVREHERVWEEICG